MSLKPKTSRRLALAGVLVVLVVGAVVALVFVRQWRKDRYLSALRTDGMAFYQAHEYAQAAEKLQAYLRPSNRRENDLEAWKAFGASMEQFDQPDGGHLRIAIDAYSRVIELDPQDRDTAVKLLRYQNRFGFFHEAQTLAGRYVRADPRPEDLEFLKGQVRAGMGLKQFDDERLGALIDRALGVAPEDFFLNISKLTMLRERKREAEATAHAERAARQFPGNLALKLLAVMSGPEAGPDKAVPAFAALCDAAGLNPQTAEPVGRPAINDEDFLYFVVSLFDALGRYAYSEAFLRSATASPDTDLTALRLAIRRSWQIGRYDKVVARLEPLDISAGGDHSDLLAFKAMSMREVGRGADARPIVDALKQRHDLRAKAWSESFDTVPELSGGAALAPLEQLRRSQGALKAFPGEPVLTDQMGRALAGVGRFDEAREAWTDASRAAPGWAAPLVEIARSYLEEGRPEEAFEAAGRVLQNYPGNVSANIAFLTAQAALMETGAGVPGDSRDTGARLEEAGRQVERMQDGPAKRALLGAIVPSRVTLAARAGHADDARAMVRAVIEAPGEPDAVLLRRLAMISVRDRLGVENDCLARAEQAEGATPAAALARALVLHQSGRTAEGLAVLKDGAAKAAGPDGPAWSRAMAQYLDASGSPDAAAAWATLCDANPDDLATQIAALRSPGVTRDIALVDRLTTRVNTLSNADANRPLGVTRLARARALLVGPLSIKSRDEAVSILRGLALEAPDSYEVRSQLVGALLKEDTSKGVRPDYAGALEQLRAMVQIAPEKAAVTLQIGTLLHGQHEYERARTELENVANDASARAELRERAVDLLIAQADFAAAAGPLRAQLAQLGEGAAPARWLKLAAVHRALRQDAEALAVYKRLSAAAPENAEQAALVANGLADGSLRSEAEAFLARLDTTKLDPVDRALARAAYWEHVGEQGRAGDEFEIAVNTAPQRADAWARYAQCMLARNDVDRAAELLARGLEKNPDSPDLRVVEQQIAARSPDRKGISLDALATALKADPSTKDKADVVRAVEEFRQSGRLGDPEAIEELRSRFPGELAVQMLAVRLLLQAHPPRTDLASRAVQASMLAFPTAPEPARLGTFIFRDRGEWAEMLKAAALWQRLARAPEADLCIAEAQLNLDQPRQAVDTLRPMLDTALKDPGAPNSASVIGLHARALIALGQEQDALKLLGPLVAQSKDLRNRVMIPIAASYIRSDARSAEWLSLVDPMIDASDSEGRLSLCAAWTTLAMRSSPPRDAYFDRAVSAVRPLADRPGPQSAGAHEAIAAVCRARSDAPGAVRELRLALEAEPQRLSALGALIDLEIAAGADPGEVQSLAERAVSAGGPSSRAGQLLLARSLQYQALRLDASGQHAQAAPVYTKAAEIYRGIVASDPTDIAPLVGLAQTQDATGDYGASVPLYERLLSSPGLSPRDRAGVQNNLAYALLKSGKGGTTLDRARSLVLEAMRTLEAAAFLDTLGAVETARGDRPAAVKAYSKAIELEPSMIGAKIELAALLVRGSAPEDRARAGALLDQAASQGASLSEEQRKRLDEVRAVVDRAK